MAGYLDGVSERKDNGERESLGHGDDEQSDADGGVVDELLDVGAVPRLTTMNERVRAETLHQYNERQQRRYRPCAQ